MLFEIKLNQEIAKRSNAFVEKCKQDLKIVIGICRVPRLSHMFQQACRKKIDQKTLEAY